MLIGPHLHREAFSIEWEQADRGNLKIQQRAFVEEDRNRQDLWHGEGEAADRIDWGVGVVN